MSEVVFVFDCLIETSHVGEESNLFTSTVNNLHRVYELSEETGSAASVLQ